MAARKSSPTIEKREHLLSAQAMGPALFGEVFPLIIAGLTAMEIDFTIDAPNPWTVSIRYEYDPEDYE